MTLTTRKMSWAHENHVAELLGGRVTKNSGATWADQTDVVTSQDDYYSWACDGKSSLGKSIGVSREMWAKLEEQGQTRLPALPLRFYRDERLSQVDLDLVVISLDTFAELVADANAYQAEHREKR